MEYGGAETVKAISRMEHLNILVFCECGHVYFPMGFNSNYHKLIFFAYRLNGKSKTERNHYDSVAEVDVNILCNLVKELTDKEFKRNTNI